MRALKFSENKPVKARRPSVVSRQSDLKARQASKVAELREVLVAAGFETLRQQATVLGLSGSTAWVVMRGDHKASGLSAVTIKRILASPNLPPEARQLIEEYIVRSCWVDMDTAKAALTYFANASVIPPQTQSRRSEPSATFERAAANCLVQKIDMASAAGLNIKFLHIGVVAPNPIVAMSPPFPATRPRCFPAPGSLLAAPQARLSLTSLGEPAAGDVPGVIYITAWSRVSKDILGMAPTLWANSFGSRGNVAIARNLCSNRLPLKTLIGWHEQTTGDGHASLAGAFAGRYPHRVGWRLPDLQSYRRLTQPL